MTQRNLVEIHTTIPCTMKELGVHLNSLFTKGSYSVSVNEDDKEIFISDLDLKIRKDKTIASFEFGQLSEAGYKYTFEDKGDYMSLIYAGEENEYACGDMKFFLPVAPNSFVWMKPLQHKAWDI